MNLCSWVPLLVQRMTWMWLRDSGVWERRRNAIIKNKKMVKLKDKDK